MRDTAVLLMSSLIRARYWSRWLVMGSMVLGITVVDVLANAINNPGAMSYHDIARLVEDHLNTRIGRLAGEAEEAERSARRA